jgi:hypothetical protein
MSDDRYKIEGEVSSVLSDMRERVKDLGPDEGLEHRLSEIEESLLALARYLDKAFAELRGEETEADPL